MASKKTEEINFSLGLKTDKFSKNLDGINKEIRKIGKQDLKLKAFDPKGLEKFSKQIKTTRDQVAKTLAKTGKALKGESQAYKKAYQNIVKVVDKNTKAINEAIKAGDKDRIKQAEETAKKEIKISRVALREKQLLLHRKVGRIGAAKTAKAEAKAAAEAAKKAGEDKAAKGLEDKKAGRERWLKAGEEIGESFTDAVKSLSAKDLVGAAKGLFSMGGRTLKHGGIAAKAFADKHKESGGLAGGMAKAINGLAPMVGQFAKLAPIMSTVSSAFMAVVKLLVDIEASAKKFNKDILETASTSEFLARSGGDSDKAFKKLDKTLKTIRDSSFDVYTNLDWGIKAEDHAKFLTSLQSEGVTWGQLSDDMLVASKSGNVLEKQMDSFSGATVTAIAYSRLFGTSLDEISRFQADMMTEMGASLVDVRAEFSRMTLAAGESGIASNKFFSIIRGISSDLSLYNTRLSETVFVLAKLGKAMSPKNAQKFLAQAAQGLKNLSEQDRLKTILLAGEGESRKILDEDMARKQKALIQQVMSKAGVSMADAMKLISGEAVDNIDADGKKVKKKLGDYGGDLVEAATEQGMDAAELKKGGTMGLATAASNASIGAAFDLQVKALKRLGGGGKLADMTGVQGFAARQATGTSMDQFRAMAKLEKAIDGQKKDLIDQLQSGDAEQVKLAKESLTKAGVDATQAGVEAASTGAIIDTMTKDQADALVASQEQVDYAKQQGELMSSALDKLDVLIDGIFNYLYNVLSGIFDAISSTYHWIVSKWGDKESRDKADAQKERMNLYKKKNSTLTKAASMEGNDVAYNIAQTVDAEARPLWTAMDKIVGKDADSVAKKDQLEKNRDADFKKIYEKSSYNEPFRGANAKKSIVEALPANVAKDILGRLDEKGLNENSSQADWSKGVLDALKEAGVNNSDIAEVMKKFMQHSLTGDLSDLVSGNSKGDVLSGLGGKKAGPATYSDYQNGTLPTAGGAAATPVGAAPVAAKQEPPVTVKQGDAITANLGSVEKGLGQIKIDKPFLNGPFDKTMYHSFLEAARQALWEYYLYQGTDKTSMLKWVADNGLDVSGGSSIAQSNLDYYAKPNATGTGPMVGQDKYGFAKFAPGEAPTSIGPGEKIVPSGQGGSQANVTINGLVPGDFHAMIVDKVNEGIYQYRLRQQRTGG